MGEGRSGQTRARPLEPEESDRLVAIELSFEEEFAVLKLNRPEALNALSFALIKHIGAAIDKVADSKARALTVPGAAEKAVAAAADIKQWRSSTLAHERA